MKRSYRYLSAMLMLAALFTSYARPVEKYLDKNLDVDTRVEDLLSKMTLHEKVLQLQNRSVGNLEDFQNRFEGYSIGTIHDMDHNASDCKMIMDSLYTYMGQTRLGIPALTCVEGIQGILQDSCTIFPQAIAQ